MMRRAKRPDEVLDAARKTRQGPVHRGETKWKKKDAAGKSDLRWHQKDATGPDTEFKWGGR